MDPSDILGEDAAFADPVDPGAGRPTHAKNPGAGRDGAPATLAECESAASRIEALGLDLALREESDPVRRAALEDERKKILASTETKARIRRQAEACIRRGTSRAEALCIAHVHDETGIDGCSE